MLSCHWLVAKPMVRPFEVPFNIQYLRTLQLVHYYSYRLLILVVFELAQSSSPYLLLSIVNLPVSLSI